MKTKDNYMNNNIKGYIDSYKCPVCYNKQINIVYYTNDSFLCNCGTLLDFVNDIIYKDINENFEHINPQKWINPIITYNFNKE